MGEPTKTIKFIGSIGRVLWSNGDFKIAIMRVSQMLEGVPARTRGNIVFKGEMFMLPQNEYVIQGTFVKHPKYGPQYDFDFAKLKNPVEKMTPKQFGQFLIGLSTKASEIVKKYPDARQIFEDHDIEALVKVKGIGRATAETLLEKYDRQKDWSPAIVAFSEYGFSLKTTQKIVDRFKSAEAAVDILKTNPYRLMQVSGLGFKTIDEKARLHGIAENDSRRVMAFLIDYFENLAMDGSSWSTVEDLKKHLHKNIFECDLVSTFKQMNDSELFVTFMRKDVDCKCVALSKYFNLEKQVTQDLLKLRDSKDFRVINEFDNIIKEIEGEQGWCYSEEQQMAIESMVNRPVNLLIGPGGVGKTTVLKALITIFRQNGLDVSACALAGKAAGNLTKVTGLKSTTIHKLLGLNEYSSQSKKLSIDSDVVIIDEISMVNLELFAKLLSALPKNVRLIMVGDNAQLDSIGITSD